MGATAVRLVYAIWASLWGSVVTAIHALLYVGAFAARRLDWAAWVERSFSRSLFAGLFVRLDVAGRENIPPGHSFVALSNHQSYLDIPALFLSLRPATLVFVTKRELLRVPFLGWAIRYSHHVVVDRGNREQAVGSLQESIKKVRSGVALGVFAEGTRSPDLKLLPFKKGGFYVAVDSGLPIVPVSISGSGRLLGKRTKLPRWGVIHVHIHPEVIPGPEGRGGIPDLIRSVRRTIVSRVPEAREAGGVALLLLSLLLVRPGTAAEVPDRWAELDRGIDVLAESTGVSADRFRVDAAAIELADSFSGRLRLERYLMSEPRRAPATADGLAAGLTDARGMGERLELLTGLAFHRALNPRPLVIDHVRMPDDGKQNPVESAMERLFAGTGQRFQGKDRERVGQESRRLPQAMQLELARLLDAVGKADRLRASVVKSSDLKQGGAFDSKSRRTAGRLREYLVRWDEPRLESDETMSRLVYALSTLDLEVLGTGAVDLARAVDAAADSLAAFPGGPGIGDLHFEWDSPVGRIGVGGSGNDTYRGAFALVIDAGGNDVYRGAGAASGNQGVALVIDLAGDDRYEPADSALAGPGGAILGYAGILDLAGRDDYVATSWGGGFGFLGMGWIRDLAGDDTYRMQYQSLGCGLLGLGLLVDDAGEDRYVLEGKEPAFSLGQSQGFGGPFGLGVLVDRAGDDEYRVVDPGDSVGGPEPRTPAGSFVQGAALGSGTRWAGGLGMLVDGGGSDRYDALHYAQGAASGAGLGILADGGGDDTYTARLFAQGAGTVLGIGLLIDRLGNDGYETAGMGMGTGFNLGMGILADARGDDRYRSRVSAHGLGMASGGFQGAGWLLDGGGEDRYSGPMLRVDPGTVEPWRSPIPGVAVWVDLEQSALGLPAGMEPRATPGPAALFPWQGAGPGYGGGLVFTVSPGRAGQSPLR